jgi:hypothetical protein
VEVEQTRKREAEEYKTLAAARVSQGKQSKERRVAEGVGPTKRERELYSQEGVKAPFTAA